MERATDAALCYPVMTNVSADDRNAEPLRLFDHTREGDLTPPRQQGSTGTDVRLLARLLADLRERAHDLERAVPACFGAGWVGWARVDSRHRLREEHHGSTTFLTSTLGAPAAALGLIEGIDDGIVGAAKVASGPLAE